MSNLLFGGNSGKKKTIKKLEEPSKGSGDLLFTGSGKVSNKKETYQTQTYTFTFEANSSKYNAQTIEANGTIQQINSPVNHTLSKLTNSSPFKEQLQTGDSVSEGDIVDVELDNQPTSQVKVEVLLSYTDESYTKAIPQELGGDGKYLYYINHTDKTISVVDIPNGVELTTITLPSSYVQDDLQCAVKYRYQEKEVWFFHSSGYSIIDADPSSANFNTYKIQDVSFPNTNIPQATVFLQHLDLFTSFQASAVHTFNKNISTVIYPSGHSTIHRKNTIHNPWTLGNLILGGDNTTASGLEIIRHYGEKYLVEKEFSDNRTGETIYNPVNGLIYNTDINRVKAIETVNYSIIAALSVQARQGYLALDRANNIIIAASGDQSSPNWYKIDADTNTLVGSLSNGTSNACDSIVWSRHTGYFYSRIRNTNRLVVLDGTQSPLNMKVTEITIGTGADGRYNSFPMACLNEIIL